MKRFKSKITPFSVAIAAVIIVTATVLISAISCSGTKINFSGTYYFVCYAAKDNSVSASSVSGAVSEYGGAGYILEHGNSFYVTVSCYYKRRDAETVCASLKKRNLNCSVLEIEADNYKINGLGRDADARLFEGNLNTLHSISAMAYECANALDTGDYGQNNAKNALSGISNGLKGLIKANGDNCFSKELRRLYVVCSDLNEGYIYSKELRKLQIAILDTVINIKLF